MTLLILFNLVTDSPADLENQPINSSDSSSTQSEQDKEGKRPGQEQEDGQEQMAEGKNPDTETQTCKLTDPDSAINSVSQLDDGLRKQDGEVPNKSKITDKGQSFNLGDNNAKVMQNEVQTQAEDSGQRHEQ